jgi:hypothetical protein
MQVATTTPAREHEQPMSWARALALAVGFFFLAAIMIAQIPGYFYTVSTLATLARFEQGTLDLGLLAVGFGLIALEIAFLYDPRPLIPPALFALVGAGMAAVGTYFVVQVARGPIAGWHEYLPDQKTVNGQQVYWPTPGQGYLFNRIWLQPFSIDISSVGMIAIVIGLGMFTYAVLCRPALAGRLDGVARTLIVRLCLAAALAIIAVFITVNTFAPKTAQGGGVSGVIPPGAPGNVLLFLALCAALLALQVWLLPIMIHNRRQFMPAVYLHGVVGLLGFIGVPLLILWAAVYPLVYLIHQVDSTQFLVQCSQKELIPGSCTFTQYTGYIIAALVVGLTFQLFAMALYFWSTRRNTVVLGATIGLVYLGLAATVIHVDDPAQLPLGLFLATCIAVLAFAFAFASQREIGAEQAGALGCTGQWLVLGTGMLIYLAGFALFSMPSFFESEALGLNYVTGAHAIHDAFWGFLLMGGLAALQFTLLARHQPMSGLRKFVLWTLLGAVALELIAAIQGFHNDLLAGGWNVAEGSHAVFVTGLSFEIVGLLAALVGVIRAASLRWGLVVLVTALVGAAVASVAYAAPGNWSEIVVFGFMFAMVGSFAYSVAGPDWPFVVARPALQTGNGARAGATPE